MIALYICIAIAVILISNFFVAAYFAYKNAYYADRSRDLSPKGRLDEGSHKAFKNEIEVLIDRLLARPCEKVSITSRDGLRLGARYYRVKDGAPVVIMVHGYRGNAQREFSGAADAFFNMGYNLLLIDHRAHGDSEGNIISFGIKERFDIADWAFYVTERLGEDTKILLAGISMGAASVLMASGEPLPASVKGVFADCPFSSPIGIITNFGAKKGIPAFFVGISAKLGSRLFAKFSLNESSALSAVEKTDLPILIIHGDGDDFVPHSMSEDIQKRNPSITLKTVSGAGHAVSYFVDTEAYVSEVYSFAQRIFGGTNEN